MLVIVVGWGHHSWIGLLTELSGLAVATAPFGAIRASPQREGFQVSPSFIPSMCPNHVVSLATWTRHQIWEAASNNAIADIVFVFMASPGLPEQQLEKRFLKPGNLFPLIPYTCMCTRARNRSARRTKGLSNAWARTDVPCIFIKWMGILSFACKQNTSADMYLLWLPYIGWELIALFELVFTEVRFAGHDAGLHINSSFSPFWVLSLPLHWGEIAVWLRSTVTNSSQLTPSLPGFSP